MLLSEHKHLKMEIRSLPEKEKDKLLLRLIAKDKVLVEHLHFKLLEDESDLIVRANKLHEEIDERIEEMQHTRKLSSKEAMLKMRKLNGSISHHFKVTKDVTTEMELKIHLLKLMPIDFREGVVSPMYRFNEKLNIYFVKSSIAVWNKFKKLHEDVQFDLSADFNAVLAKVYQHKTAALAEELGLPKEL